MEKFLLRNEVDTFAMTVNANTPCQFTLGLTHGCKTFEFTNIARSGRLTIVFSRALYLPFADNIASLS